MSKKAQRSQEYSPLYKVLTAVALGASVLTRGADLHSDRRAHEDLVAKRVYEYSRGEIFVDSQPPLGYLVYYWLSLAFGKVIEDGSIEPTAVMRAFPAALSVITIVLTFLMLRTSGCHPIAQFAGIVLLAFENSLGTYSTILTSDSLVVFGSAVAIYGIKTSQKHPSFTRKWTKSLLVTGLGLGFAVSVRYSGILTIVWVIALTVLELWQLLGDKTVSDGSWFAHAAAYFTSVVIMPLTIYLSVFFVHFASLPFNGSGSGALPPVFKSTLKDSQFLNNMPVEVLYGSTVTLRHNEVESYLHSHNFNYRGGTQQQQVSLYDGSDDYNNEWILETIHKTREGELQKKYRPIKDGDTVRLFHKATGRFMRVNDVRPPISEHDYANEVSCNSSRDELLADGDYEFKVRILARKSHSKNQLPLRKLRATESIFQLHNPVTRCTMLSHHDRLPRSWGFGQNEVACFDEPTIPNTLWYIEHNSHPLLDENPDSELVQYGKVGFLYKVWEYHKAMFRQKYEAKTVEDELIGSSPESWPFAVPETPIDDYMNPTIYAKGNAFIYITGVLFVLVVANYHFFHVAKRINPFQTFPIEHTKEIFYKNSLEALLGWIIGYFPYFYISDSLRASDYLVALYFSILTTVWFVDYQVKTNLVFGATLVVILAAGATYYSLSKR